MGDIEKSLAENDTFPKILISNAQKLGDRPAWRKKEYGIWQTVSWKQAAVIAREMGLGLVASGLKRGDKVAIVGQNTTTLYISFDAIQSVGGIPVPLYADAVADEMAYVLKHAEVRFAICQNQEQIDKIESNKEIASNIERLFYEEPRGLRKYDPAFITSVDTLREMGREYDAKNPDFFLAQVAEGKGADLATMIYTSGTTGNPKGVMLSFDALCKSAKMGAEMDGLRPGDDMLAYLPLAWIGDHYLSFAQQHMAGFTVNCPESPDTVLDDLKDIGPTYMLAPPAIFESFLTQIGIRIGDAAQIKQSMYKFFLKVARRVGPKILDGEPVGLGDRLLYALGELCVYGPLKNNFGLSRARIAYTGGAPLGEEVFSFYRSIGVNLKQLYGQTESSAYICLQRNGDARTDTVGPPAPGVEVKIAEDGEVIYRSPGNFMGYYKNDEETAKTKGADGWIHTGDAGILTDTGHVKIIDRAKDVGKMTDGTVFAPQYLENKLKFYPFIREAVAHGDGRDHVTAFINIDLEAVGDWAERNGVSYSGYTDLAGHTVVYDLIEKDITEVNQGLAYDSELSSSQIRRFLILHKELDADDGELTRTRKVRRNVIAERYDDLIDALYSDKDQVSVEATVAFEDGRTGVIKADLAVRSAQTFEPMREAG
ncbi:MAG: AMP-binding protein [Rhodospirillaceae bacterium]|nr:AMP-binding protein [Rhodospirillaceae bacterium]